MSPEIYIPNFDEHYVGDNCNVMDTREWGQIWKLTKKLVRDRFKKDGWVFPVENMMGYLEERQLISKARKTLVDFILMGGNQSVSLADYTSPSIFDPNKHNLGSIVRIERGGFHHDRLYYPPQFREIFGEYEQRIDTISGQCWLGVISDIKFKGRRVVVCFMEDEKEITVGRPIYGGMLDYSVTLGAWNHTVEVWMPRQILSFSLNTARLESGGVYVKSDSFNRIPKIEVLQIGKPVQTKKNMQLVPNKLVTAIQV